MLIGGVMSSVREDEEQERVLQKGLDLDYFKGHGALRWMHTPPAPKDDDPEIAKVGKPLSVEQNVEVQGRDGKLSKGTKFTAVLFKGNPTAEKIFRNAQAMAEEGDAFGVSLEGNIQSRTGGDGKTIAKAVVRSLAIAPHPVNPDAQMRPLQLAKALQVAQLELDSTTDTTDGTPADQDSGEELGKAATSASVQPLSRESLDGGKTTELNTPKGGRKSTEDEDKEKAMDELRKQLDGLSEEDLKKVLEPYRDKIAPADKTEEKRLNKALTDATECLDDLSEVLGVDRDAIPADADTLRENVDNLAKAVAEIHELLPSQGQALIAFGHLAKAMGEDLAAFREEVNERLEVLGPLAKALGKPAPPRGVVDGAQPADHPAEAGAQDGETLSKSQAVRAISAKMLQAQQDGNDQLFTNLGRYISEMEGESRLQTINKAALNKQLNGLFGVEV